MPLPQRPAHLTDLEFTRVLTTYVYAQALAPGRLILDAGCGTGHGSWLLRERHARKVVAVDLDPANADLVRGIMHGGDRLAAAVMDVQRLALSGSSFDMVVCFEVIEHVPDPARLLVELRRVAVPGSLILISTPNREVRLRPGQRPWNPEHQREYDRVGLVAELSTPFRAVEVLGIHGVGPLHHQYVGLWRPGADHFLRRALRAVVPLGLRRRIRSALVRRCVPAEMADGNGVPVPEPQTWPFYLSRTTERCLNFFAVCGDDVSKVVEASRALLVRGG